MAKIAKNHDDKIFDHAFEAYDTNGDGTMNSEELGKLFESLGIPMTDEKLADLAKKADANGSGRISKKEFLKFTQDPVMEVMRMWLDTFKKYDPDGSGQITLSELKKIMKENGRDVTDAQLGKFMKHSDKDGDGDIDYEEFLNSMQRSIWVSFV